MTTAALTAVVADDEQHARDELCYLLGQMAGIAVVGEAGDGMAAWALAQPGGKLPAGVKMANVNFYRSHEAELAKLGELTKEAGCDDR